MRTAALPLLAAALAAALLLPRLAVAGSPLHPPIPLLDADGKDVLGTGRPVSPLATCGQCHDTQYIATHSYHASVGADEQVPPGTAADGRPWSTGPGLFGRWYPMRYRRLTIPGEGAFDLGVADWIRVYGDRHVGGGPAWQARDGSPLAARVATSTVDPETHVLDERTGRPVPWDWQASGAVEMNCFLCHLADPANEERVEALRAGRFAWAATATLGRTGLVRPAEEGRWTWVRERFDAAGLAPREVLRLGDAQPSRCGLCHGVVHGSADPVRLARGPGAWETETKGQVFSGQRVADSALNLADKGAKTFAWDVHAQRLVTCVDCHPSINNPTAFAEATRSRPRHLAYDARRLAIGDYLKTPSHHLAKGWSAQGNVARRLDGSMRRCEDCHDVLDLHATWLPNARRHLAVMLCETCHTPAVAAPAHEACDWTVLTDEGGPVVHYRGVAGDVDDPAALVTGYEPVVLPRTDGPGHVRHGPHNLCTAWWWVSGEDPRPVPLAKLVEAWRGPDDRTHPDLVRALDADGDGRLATAERRLDSEARVAAVRARLAAVGVPDARIMGQTQPMSLHHSVVPGRFATRACATCHARDSRMTRPFELAPYVPGGVLPSLVGDANVRLAGTLATSTGGALLFTPRPTAAGRYLIGHDRAGWIDVLGVLLILATVAAAGLHALGRVAAARRRAREAA